MHAGEPGIVSPDGATRAIGCDAATIWAALARVPDPELPFVSVVELGIVRGVERGVGCWRVLVTPTFSGCPATWVIEADIRAALEAAAPGAFEIVTRLAPPWTTDAIAPEARRKLVAAGIAPPGLHCVAGGAAAHRAERVTCPRCGSVRTTEVAHFGSTPCKAQFRCDDCLEPFDHFKAH